MRTRSSYATSFGAGTVSFGVSALLGLAVTVVTARIYGVRVAGEFALAVAPSSVVILTSTVREQPTLVRRLAPLPAGSPTATGLFVAVFAFSAALTSVVTALAAGVSWWAFHGPLSAPDLFLPAAANLVGYLLITNSGWNMESVLTAYRAAADLFWIRLVQPVAYLALAVALSGTLRGVWALTLAWNASWLVSLVQRTWAVRHWIPLRVPREELRAGWQALPEMLRFGVKLTPGGLADGIGREAGTWLLGALLTVSAVGAYSRAWAIGRRLLDLQYRIAEVLLPTLVERRLKAEEAAFSRALVDSVRYATVGLLLPAAAVGGAARGVMAFYGPGFESAASALAVLLLVPAVLTIVTLQVQALIALDRPMVTTVGNATGLGVNIAVSVPLIKALGVVGPALGLLAGALTTVAVLAVAVRGLLWRAFAELWPARVTIALVLAYVAGFAAAHAVDRTLPGAAGGAAGSVAGALAYAGAFIACGGALERDRRRAADLLARVRRAGALARAQRGAASGGASAEPVSSDSP